MIKKHIIKQMSEKKQVLVLRVLIVVFIAISAFIAINKDKLGYIADMMGISWGALAGAFLAPFLYGLYWKGTTSAACWVSFIFSTVVMIANIFFRSSFPALLQSPINVGAFCMIAGLIIVPIVSVCTRKPDRAFVEDCFAGYNKKVLVPQSEALSDGEEV
jgi:SSS family solute:Na+ symporter